MSKKSVAAITLLTVVLASLLPALLFAQGELTLESLAEQLTALTGRVDQLEQQLKPGAIVDDDGNCRLALVDRLHPTSLVSYLEKYPDAETPDSTDILNVYIVVGTGVAVTFQTRQSSNYVRVTEYWNGCEFSHSSEWQAYDIFGNPVAE